MMKRVAAALALVAALVVPAAATAGKPSKYPIPTPDADFPAGLVCSFETTWHADPNKLFEIDHFSRDGSFAWGWAGGNTVTHVTNAENGNSVSLNTTGPGKLTFNDDGSATVDGVGHFLVAYFPGDSPSSSLIYYSGHIVVRISATGQLTLVSYVGAPPQDVCAMIA
jgi:hypothetical protein